MLAAYAAPIDYRYRGMGFLLGPETHALPSFFTSSSESNNIQIVSDQQTQTTTQP